MNDHGRELDILHGNTLKGSVHQRYALYCRTKSMTREENPCGVAARVYQYQ